MDPKVKEITEKIQTSMDVDLIESTLKNNVFEFELDGEKFRVRKPTFSEKNIVYKKKVEKFTELIKDKSLMLESAWIKQYKERGVDIDELDDRMVALQKQKENLQLVLGKEIEAKGSEEDLKKIKDEIVQIQTEQAGFSVQKTTLLQFSIEYQLNVYVYSILTTLIAETEVNGTWVKVWKSYEEFENSDEKKVNKITFYASLIIRDETLL